MAEFLAPEDLTPLLWSVMAAVQEAPGRDQKHGAHHVGVDAVNFGQMIDVLEAKGLVERKTDDGDRRARKLYITERGTSLRERLSPTLRSAQERLLAPLSKAERVALVDMLVRVIEANDSVRASRQWAAEAKARTQIRRGNWEVVLRAVWMALDRLRGLAALAAFVMIFCFAGRERRLARAAGQADRDVSAWKRQRRGGPNFC